MPLATIIPSARLPLNMNKKSGEQVLCKASFLFLCGLPLLDKKK